MKSNLCDIIETFFGPAADHGMTTNDVAATFTHGVYCSLI